MRRDGRLGTKARVYGMVVEVIVRGPAET